MVESMFDNRQDAAAFVDRMCAASRAENRAAGERLAAIGELDVFRLRECGERETWSTDTWDAISAEVAAALGISAALASSLLDYSRAMRIRLPQVGAALLAGDISYSIFQTIVYRTNLITDTDVVAAVDAELAVKVRRWPSDAKPISRLCRHGGGARRSRCGAAPSGSSSQSRVLDLGRRQRPDRGLRQIAYHRRSRGGCALRCVGRHSM